MARGESDSRYMPVAFRRVPHPEPVVEELGAGQGQNEDGVGARPLQQVVDELQERSVGPLAVLECHDHRAVLGHPLEEQPPPGEQVLLLSDLSFLQAQEVGQAGLHPPPFRGVRYITLHRRAQLGSSGRGVLSLHDVRPAPDHLRQRPVRDAVSIGQTSSPVPPVRIGQPVHVLVELPPKPGLADPCYPDNRHQVGIALVASGMEGVLQKPELPIPAYEGGVQAL